MENALVEWVRIHSMPRVTDNKGWLINLDVEKKDVTMDRDGLAFPWEEDGQKGTMFLPWTSIQRLFYWTA